MSETTAKTFDLHLGEVVRFGVYTNAQTALRTFGTAADVPIKTVSARLVGIVISPTAVVEDDTDVSNNANLFVFTPALVRPLLSCCAYYTATAVTVSGGHANIAVVQHEISHILPPGFSPFATNQAPALDAKAERAIKPESIALGVFGGDRRARGTADRRPDDRSPAPARRRRSRGAPGRRRGDRDDDRATHSSAILGAVVVGVAPRRRGRRRALTLAPLGPVRPVYPYPGVAFDWTVLGIGLAVLVVGLGALSVALAYRVAPTGCRLGSERADRQGSGVVTAAARAGLPAPAVAGIRFALESGRGRDAVPVRSAILGAALAVIVVVATVTFGSSLNTLVSHPALYGWNWSYELSANGGGVLPGATLRQAPRQRTTTSPGRRGSSSTSSGSTARSGCRSSPSRRTPRWLPRCCRGTPSRPTSQIVLGAITLAQLHKHVGDTVSVANGIGRTVQLRIVGTVTMPTIGGGTATSTRRWGRARSCRPAIFPEQDRHRLRPAGRRPGSGRDPRATAERCRRSGLAFTAAHGEDHQHAR